MQGYDCTKILITRLILFEMRPNESYVTQPMYLLLKEKWDNIWSGPENKFLVPFTFEDGYPG